MQENASVTQRPCWCGNTDLQPFADDYVRCPACETLVVKTVISDSVSVIADDETDLYGKTYFTSHQKEDYGLPDLPTRARADLPERCSHWLRSILKYKLPPGASLELGSAHGGFVAMMRRAGFDARGLDLSPWLVEFSSKTFEVPILCGMVEKQPIERGSLDIICLFDVLEHLPDPKATMSHCLSLLKPGGFLAVQTPCYPEGRTLEEVLAAEPAFAAQFKPREHIHIFSRTSVKRLFEELGAPEIAFETAIFSHYDMFPFVSRVPFQENPTAAIEEALQRTADGRIMLALLDATQRAEYLQRQCDKRLVVIEGLRQARDAANETPATVKTPVAKKTAARKIEAKKEVDRLKLPWALRHPRKALGAVFRGRSLIAPESLGPARSVPQVCLVNLVSLNPPSNGGLARVAREVCRLLMQEQREGRVTVFFVLGEMYYSHFHEWLGDYAATRIPWDVLTRIPATFGLLRPDFILHPLLGTTPFDSPKYSGLAPHLVSMPDALALDHPEFFDEAEQQRRRKLYDQLPHAAGVLTLSRHSRKQLTEHLGLEPAKVHVVNLAGDFTATPVLPQGVAEPFILYPANDWPHKRHALLFHAFAEIRRVRPELRLILTGHHSVENLRELAAAAGVPEQAFADLGRVSDDELAGLYTSAEAMLFTSQYEGFGMPLLEAMHFKCPVICEALTSIPEVAGDAAIYVSGDSPVTWAEAFLQRLPAEREGLVERGLEQSRLYSWTASMKAYRRALIAGGLRLDAPIPQENP